ncbi:MAG: hypothetical protein MI757_10015 [Pirellulales bacterium]|nr:hypothetical protein [Pirellulales bacterium]
MNGQRSVISRRLLMGMAALVILFSTWREAHACPFCYALKPTLAQQRSDADIVAVLEAVDDSDGARDFTVHQLLKGSDQLDGGKTLRFDPEQKTAPGQLFLAFGSNTPDAKVAIRWKAVPATETSLAYAARSPATTLPYEKRLPYFARYFEHPEPLIAEDAYLEFGHAPYDKVRQVANEMPMEDIRNWIVDSNIPQFRKGFYGLALGLATNDDDRKANTALLREIIDTPASDFRQGFDGVLGGYLVAEGPKALEHIEQRYLANPKSRPGDVKHTLSALRFYYEFGEDIDPKQLAASLAKLLERREFAAEVIVDLARWEHWSVIDQVASMYNYDRDTTLTIRRAIVGYLLACPLPAADEALDRLRARDPKGVAKAEQYHRQLRALSE